MKLPNIMEMFRAPTATAAPTAQTPPGNIQTPASGNNGTMQNDNVAPNGVVPADAKKEESPLDQYKDLWENEVSKDGEAPAPVDFSKQVTEAANKTDFSKNINPETLKRIAAGGEESIAAFAEAMNVMARQAFAASSITADRLVKAELAKAREEFSKQIPSMLKKENLSSSLREDNPALSHPSAQPLIQAIEQQIITKYPDATNAQIREKAKQYLEAFAGVASGKQKQATTDTQATANAGENWDKYFDM